MKKGILFLLFVSLSMVALAKKDYNTIYVKSIDLTLKKTPGGIFMSQEITNGLYLAFLNDLIAQGKTAEAILYTPDSLQWQKVGLYNQPYVEHYFRHPVYKEFPVVGITLECATAFGHWLAAIIKADEKLNLPNAECALPSETEWITAAAPFYDNPYPWYGPYAYNDKGEMQCNVRLKRIDATDYSGMYALNTISLTTYSSSFYPNRHGLYNMIGNVAELTSEGYIKGGSWNHTIDECAINKRQEIELPSALVGFRIALKPEGTAVSSNK